MLMGWEEGVGVFLFPSTSVKLCVSCVRVERLHPAAQIKYATVKKEEKPKKEDRIIDILYQK